MARPPSPQGRAPFGTLDHGVVIEAVTLTNQHGISARIVNYGATLQALQAPDRNGRTADIVLGYDDLAAYVEKPNFFGVTVGRYANRIAGGRFALDGKTYQLSLNDQVQFAARWCARVRQAGMAYYRHQGRSGRRRHDGTHQSRGRPRLPRNTSGPGHIHRSTNRAP